MAVLVLGAATVVALLGGLLLPWLLMLTRTVSKERAGRARAEERAAMAAHLHDSVLQTLTLIQKRAEDSRSVRRLARTSERELRAWLYDSPSQSADFAAAVQAVVDEVEDRFDVTIGLVTVGTCPLDSQADAVVGAVREALTNAAKHSQARYLSVFAEVAAAEFFALVRDRGRGFDPAAPATPSRRGITDSIEARMRQHGGTATIRSTPGQGTEVELRLPVAAAWHD